jgi:phosphoserine phosphatase RsbU/P
MGFDLKATVEALFAGSGEGADVPPERERVAEALRQAYEAGRTEVIAADGGLDPALEVMFFRELMKSLPDYVYFKDDQSRFITVNPAHAAHFGAPIHEIVGKNDFDFFFADDARQKLADEQRILETGRGFPPRVEHQFKHSGQEMWVLTTKHPWHDASGKVCGTFGHTRDVTAKTLAERAFEEQHRLLQTLIDVLPCRIFVRDREHRFRLINEEYRRSFAAESLESVIGHRFEDLVDDNRVQTIAEEDETIMRTGVPVLRRIEFDTSPVETGKWLSVSKVPLRNADGMIEGIVGVAFDISAQKEAEARVRATGRELATKNDQIESELALARRLQVALATFRFPEHLRLCGHCHVRAAYLYKPSEHLAGDFFQLLPIDDHRFAAFICDVMGHGVRSALVTAVIRGLIEENRADLAAPATLFNRLNRVLFRLAQDPDFPRFVTAAFALFDTATATIQIVNAGHPPMLRFREGDEPESCGPMPVHRNPALGLVDQFSYRATVAPFESRCSYVFYTDGLLEQTNEKGEEFGREGISRALCGLGTDQPEALMHRLEQALGIHAGTLSFADDVCAMALSVEGLDPPEGQAPPS